MRKVLGSLAALLLLLAVVVTGIGWYFSGQVLAVQPPSYPLTVRAADATTVTLPRFDYLSRPGTYGLFWDGGHARVGDVVRTDAESVTRTLVEVERGSLRTGQQVGWDAYVYDGDPKSAHGLAFADVRYRSDVGELPAWHVPGRADTWVVYVHGRAGNRRGALRFLPALHRAGYPVLVPSYRNDEGAPQADGHQYRIGATEWRDVEGAMRWAKERGARRFVLFGESMGGGIVLQAADRSALAGDVAGLVLDSPAVSWRDILTFQASERNLPAPLTGVALWMLEQRADLSLDQLDWAARARELRRPALLFHGPDDTYVPWQPSERLAAQRPDLVRLARFAGADHIQSWNVDPSRYDRDLLAFLGRTAPVRPAG